MPDSTPRNIYCPNYTELSEKQVNAAREATISQTVPLILFLLDFHPLPHILTNIVALISLFH